MRSWLNPEGFRLVPILGPPPTIWKAELDRVNPLTWVDRHGWHIQPDRYELTDLGSIPRLLWPLVPPDRCPRSWLLHDSAYSHHGLWASPDGRAPYVFTPMSRGAIDDLMFDGMRAEGLNLLYAWLVYRAVRMFGWMAWARKPGERKLLRRLKAWTGLVWPPPPRA